MDFAVDFGLVVGVCAIFRYTLHALHCVCVCVYRNGRMPFWSNLINSKAQRVLRHSPHISFSNFLFAFAKRSDIWYAFVKSHNVRSLVNVYVQLSDSVNLTLSNHADSLCHQNPYVDVRTKFFHFPLESQIYS